MKIGIVFIVTTIVVILSVGALIISTDSTDKSESTTLVVKNSHPSDTVLVYLTINAGTGYVSDVNGVFGITSTNKTQGSFYLAPNDSVSYTSKSKIAFSGNISFWSPPLNCPFNGTTLYEFTLNNQAIAKNAQETVDISCVAGVTTLGEISMSGGDTTWTDNVHKNPITSIINKELFQNTGISGVFPYGCTNCTNTEGAPVCDNSPSHYATPNTDNLCNVQRNALNNGGTVTISYLNKSK